MVLKVTKEDYPVPEDGEYIAELFNIEPFSSEAHPEYGTSLKFTFKVLEEPNVGTLVSGLTSAVWRAGSKLDKWLTGLGLETSSIGDELDLQALKGRQARVYVEKDEKSGYTNIKHVKILKSDDSQRIVSKPVAKVETPVAQPVVAPVQPKATFVPKKRDIPF